MSSESAGIEASVWSRGSYTGFARRYLPMAADLVNRTQITSGDRVLDVGCGTGIVAISAARAGAAVTGLDVTPTMLDRARENAEIAGVDRVEWHHGDATDLPFEDDTFDAYLSNLGHMYGDPPSATVSDLSRVIRPGGQIGFTSWTPTSLFPLVAGQVLSHVDPSDHPSFSEPPFLWGDRATVERRLESGVRNLTFETRSLPYHTLSPAHFWRELQEQSGTIQSLLSNVDDRESVTEDVIATIAPHYDESVNGFTLEYLVTVGRIPPDE